MPQLLTVWGSNPGQPRKEDLDRDQDSAPSEAVLLPHTLAASESFLLLAPQFPTPKGSHKSALLASSLSLVPS